MMRRTLSITLVSTTLWISTWAAAPSVFAQSAATNPRTLEQASAQINHILAYAEQLRGILDKRQFDLEALLDSTDHDADQIIQFVTKEIAFEAYQGLLRGPQGTLLSRAGNALDQSVLGAHLLKNAGFEAVIAQGRLSAEDASRLIQEMTEERVPRTDAYDPDEALRVVYEFGVASGLPPETLQQLQQVDFNGSKGPAQDLAEQLLPGADLLRKSLKKAGVDLEPRSEAADLAEEATEYHWIRYREGPSDPWKDAHVAFSRSGPHDPSEVVSVLAGEIPPDLQHRLRIEVSIEQKVGDKTDTRPLMQAWERPVSNLVGVPVALSFVPMNLVSSEFRRDPEVALAEAEFFLPVFMDDFPAGGQAFDLKGRTIAPDNLTMGAAGIFKTVSDKVDSAAAALNSLGSKAATDSEKSMIGLNRLMATYTFISPSGVEHVVERDLFDISRWHAAAGADDEEVRNLKLRQEIAQIHTLMVAPGAYPEAYSNHVLLGQLIESGPALHAGAAWAWSGGEDEVPQELQSFTRTNYSHLRIFGAFDQFQQAREGVVSYRHEAAALLLSEPLIPSEYSAEGVTDIVSNRKRVIRATDRGLVDSASEQILAGVWETALEGMGLPDIYPEATPMAQLENATSSDEELMVLTAEDSGNLDELGLSLRTRRYIQRDLDDGFVVLARHDGLKNQGDHPSWWRVNPNSGETLGMRWNGRGANVVEYVIVLISIAIGGIAGFLAWKKCVEAAKKKGPDAGGMCWFCAMLAGIIVALTVFVAFGVGTVFIPMKGAGLVGVSVTVTDLTILSQGIIRTLEASATLMAVFSAVVTAYCAVY